MTAGVDLVAAFVLFAAFAVTLVRLELFSVFSDRFGFFIVCPLHGTREPYTCLERSKVQINFLICGTWFAGLATVKGETGIAEQDRRQASEVYSPWQKQDNVGEIPYRSPYR